MDAADVTTVYVEGSGPESLAEAIRALRKGTRIAVLYAWLLAEPKTSTKAQPRASLFAAMKAIEDRGGILWELATDRTSDSDGLDIVQDAVEALAKGGRGLKSAANGARSRGRPKMNWEPWKDIMKREWESLKHATNADATRAMQEQGVPVRDKRQAEYVLGASGRGN